MGSRSTVEIGRQATFAGLLSLAIPMVYVACMPDVDALGARYGQSTSSSSSSASGSSSSASSTAATTGVGGASSSATGMGGEGGGVSASSGASTGGGLGGAGGETPDAGIEPGWLPGTATADSEQVSPAHPAGDANDGNPNTRWTANNAAAGHYWTLDLGSTQALQRIEITWEYPFQAIGKSYGYSVNLSDDGVTFTTSIDQSASTETSKTQVHSFPDGAAGRYVRILVSSLPPTSNLGTTWAGIYEVRVYAPKPP